MKHVLYILLTVGFCTLLSGISLANACLEKVWTLARSNPSEIGVNQDLELTWAPALPGTEDLYPYPQNYYAIVDYDDGSSPQTYTSNQLNNNPTTFHTYTQEGVYNVTATLYNGGGCTSTVNFVLVVSDNIYSNDIFFTSPTLGSYDLCEGDNINYEINTSGLNSGDNIVEIYWAEGDGTYASNTSLTRNIQYSAFWNQLTNVAVKIQTSGGYDYKIVKSPTLILHSSGTYSFYPSAIKVSTFETNAYFNYSYNPQNGQLYVYLTGWGYPLAGNMSGWVSKFYINGVFQTMNTFTNFTSSNSIFIGAYTVSGTSLTLKHELSYSESDQICPDVYEININLDTICVDECNSFKPEVGEKYWVSAWVKEDHINQQLTYNSTLLEIEFLGAAANAATFYPSGEIIEGWQRIVGEFTVPTGTFDLKLNLVNNLSSTEAYFDDIRVHNYHGSMKSYVYDPETYWLRAELDENNYATFYEYDLEGQLIRIKKETERGIFTIQEGRSSINKTENQ